MIERRVLVARQAGRRRLRAVVVGSVVVALGAGLFGLAQSPLISARSVQITGAVHTTRAEILAVSGLGHDPPLIDVNTAADAHAIERLPWVDKAVVSVSFPSSVRVVVTERRPVAMARLASGRVALLDVTGRVLADVARPRKGLVLLLGLGALPAPGGAVRGATGLFVAAAALPAGLASRVAALAIRPGLGIVAEVHRAPQAILGATTDLRAKYVGLATVLSEVSLQGIATIDLRAPSDPVLTP
jgi:cell division protein FtsQ